MAVESNAENLSEGCGFDDVTDLLYALEPWSSKFPRQCVVQLQGWLCASVSSTKPGKLLELLHTLSMSRGATEYCSSLVTELRCIEDMGTD
ncbi:unnamed protein product [Cladocopium goreaui]|uniref:Uncharacterized protein n=1 Tax=Cladocopium goreaui TaxID=2562237 RepID=A0A9P1GPP3_9DINO|nr:unnamed protein product [Cladocopium goreaui]